LLRDLLLCDIRGLFIGTAGGCRGIICTVRGGRGGRVRILGARRVNVALLVFFGLSRFVGLSRVVGLS
jgi:hypothetical protein